MIGTCTSQLTAVEELPLIIDGFLSRPHLQVGHVGLVADMVNNVSLCFRSDQKYRLRYESGQERTGQRPESVCELQFGHLGEGQEASASWSSAGPLGHHQDTQQNIDEAGGADQGGGVAGSHQSASR